MEGFKEPRGRVEDHSPATEIAYVYRVTESPSPENMSNNATSGQGLRSLEGYLTSPPGVKWLNEAIQRHGSTVRKIVAERVGKVNDRLYDIMQWIENNTAGIFMVQNRSR